MRRGAAFGLMLAGVFGCAELLCWATAKLGGNTLRFLDVPGDLDDPARAKDYLLRRDPVLGWLPLPSEAVHVDATSSRFSPAFPEPGHACVSVYGDSFAWGADANDEDTWTNVLAKKLRCRVANYGSPGYGTDQALLRFERQTEDEAPLVVLTVFPDNLLRCLTHYIWLVVVPTLDYRGEKPRFVLDENGELKLLPMPLHSVEEMLAFADDPFPLLQGEFFEPRGYYARNHYAAFPHIYSVGRFLAGEQFLSMVQTKITGKPAIEEYLQPGHPSGAFELELAILARFAKVASERHKAFLIVMLPDREVVAQFQSKKIWSHSELMARTAEFANVVNFGQFSADHLGSRSFRELEHPGGHYTTEGYAELADAVAKELPRLSSR